MIDNDYHSADAKLKFCIKCKHVWQPWYKAIGRMISYPDFPSIGKERVVCLICKKLEDKSSKDKEVIKDGTY